MDFLSVDTKNGLDVGPVSYTYAAIRRTKLGLAGFILIFFSRCIEGNLVIKCAGLLVRYQRPQMVTWFNSFLNNQTTYNSKTVYGT